MSANEVSRPKIAIVGAGFVGTTFAYSLMIHGLASQIIIIDIDKQRAEGEVMDLTHGMPFVHPTSIRTGEYPDCKDADIIVITVDKGHLIRRSRLELAQDNFEIMKEIIPNITRYNKDCILLVVTNPLDVMTYAALKLSKFPKNRVIGSGTALDSARLRYLVSDYFKIDSRNVHAYIIGEHGDSEVPVWSLANVAGIRLKDYCLYSKVKCDSEVLDSLFLKVRNAAYEIISRKGRTNYAVALSLTRIVESIIRNENSVLTISCFLENYHGVSDICLSVPVVLNSNGVREIIKLPLEEKEINSFRESAATIRQVTDSLKI